jgi:hypothetical protein
MKVTNGSRLEFFLKFFGLKILLVLMCLESAHGAPCQSLKWQWLRQLFDVKQKQSVAETSGLSIAATIPYQSNAVTLIAPQMVKSRGKAIDLEGAQELYRLGGNVEGAYRVRLADGRTVVKKSYTYANAQERSEIHQMIKFTTRLGDRGIFVKTLKATVTEVSKERGFIEHYMEDMARSSSEKQVIGSGDGRSIGELQRYIKDRHELVSIAERYLMLLGAHPDGHPLNVMWRLRNTANGPEVEIKMIDPFSKIPSPQQQWLRWHNDWNQGASQQYNVALQRQQVFRDFGLRESELIKIPILVLDAQITE